jgi:gliding motility-associated-like protein
MTIRTMGREYTNHWVLFIYMLCPFWMWSQRIEHEHSTHHAFVENKGQWPSNVLFKSHFDGGNLWIQQKEFIFQWQDFGNIEKLHHGEFSTAEDITVRQQLLRMELIGSQNVSEIVKNKETSQYYNFFIGNDPSKWKSEVRGYSEATLSQIYSGIDLKLLEHSGQLKYEFHVLPQSDPKQIRLKYTGHSSIEIDGKGNLIVRSELGQLKEEKPYAYQIVNGNIRQIACSFQVVNSEVTFQLGEYRKDVALVIDPELIFATYSGSITDNFGMTATYGYDGTAYSAGIMYGNQYPTPDPLAWDVNSNLTVPNTNVATTDVFISKYAADGSTMLWTTFVGGGDNTQGTETANSLICDQSNNIYIYGVTSSTDFPIFNGFQNSHGGGSPLSVNFNGTNFGMVGTDIFVAKFSANGQNLLGSTYMGGSGNDGVNYKVTSGNYNSVAAYDSLSINYGDQFRGEIMLDQNNNCIVASCSRSGNFPTLNAIQNNNAGMQDGVVFCLTNNLSSLNWSSYYGGSNNDACYSVKVDSSYNIVIAGGTSSPNLPFTTTGYQPAYGGGKTDGFVLKLLNGGTLVQNASYLGMSNSDQAFFVEIDRNDNIFVVGQSVGGTFPVVNSPYSNPGSSQFVIKLNPALQTNLRSTVFGNGTPNINISPAAFLVDICGNVYISGWGANILQSTPLSGMPVTPNAFQGTPPNGFDFYLLVLKRDFQDILYGSYIGGASAQEHVDGGTSRFDKNGVVYQSVCGGCGGNSDFPVSANAWSAQNLSSNCNNLIFKFDFQLIPVAEFSADQTQGCQPFTVTLDNFSTTSDAYLWNFGNGDTTSQIFNPTVQFDDAGTYNIYLYVTDSVCLLTDTAEITITVLDSIQLSVPTIAELCSPVPMTFSANSFGTADYFVWSSNSQFTDTLNVSTSDSILQITPQGTTTYYVMAGNASCSKVDSVYVSFISSSLQLFAEDSLCLGESTTINAINLNPSISFIYTWGPDSLLIGPNGANQVNVSPDTSQYIYVTASASNGCIVQDSILITVSQLTDQTVQASAASYLIPEGTETTLYGSPSGLNYTWEPSEFINVLQGDSASTLALDQTTLFTLTGSDGICEKSDTVLIKVYGYVCGPPYIYIPNAFTPNGDDENDVLYVRGMLLESMLFRVFDRWGELVFESTNRSDGWDGTFKGRPLDPDVYDYYLQAVCIDGEENILKGNVTLMK